MKKEQKEKMIVYSIAVIIFAVILYFIFAPSSDQKDDAGSFKTDLPDGTSKPIVDSKRMAYSKHDNKNNTIRSFNEMYDLTSDTIRETSRKPSAVEEDIFRDVKNADNQVRDIYAAMSADEEYNNLVKEKQELEKKVAKMEYQQREAEVRMQQEQATQMIEQAKLKNKQEKETAPVKLKDDFFSDDAKHVSALTENAVSTLSDEDHESEKEYQHGFNTPVGVGYEMGANTIRACIHQEQTLVDGQRVKLRLLESLRAGSVVLPPGHVISGVAKLQKDRLDILINSLEYGGSIIPVAMTVYDTDGSAGIYCPGSEELNAAKEITANAGSSLGSSISFATSAGQQIAMDVTRGLISGGSQYLSKKMRVVKVTLKENYQVLLLPKKK